MDENIIFLAMQKEMNIDDPKEDDIYSVGTVAKVKQMLKLPNGTLRVLVEGLHRARSSRVYRRRKCSASFY